MVGGYPGYPHGKVWMVGGTRGTPRPGLDGGGYPGYPRPGLVGGRGYPQPGLDGVPPTPIRQSSIASTCYPAGGMPLTFTQKDFLV